MMSHDETDRGHYLELASIHLQYVYICVKNMSKWGGGIPMTKKPATLVGFAYCENCLCVHLSESDKSVQSCGHLCCCHSHYAAGLRETQQRSRQLLVSTECWYAGLLPDWFSQFFNTTSLPLYLSESEGHSRRLRFWTQVSQILLRWAVVYCI